MFQVIFSRAVIDLTTFVAVWQTSLLFRKFVKMDSLSSDSLKSRKFPLVIFSVRDIIPRRIQFNSVTVRMCPDLIDLGKTWQNGIWVRSKTALQNWASETRIYAENRGFSHCSNYALPTYRYGNIQPEDTTKYQYFDAIRSRTRQIQKLRDKGRRHVSMMQRTY